MDPIYYPGTVDVFRAAMDRLAPDGEWRSSYGDRVQLFERSWLPDGRRSPFYGYWALKLHSEDPKDRSRRAEIMALQLRGELLPWGEPRTVLAFRDAHDATWLLKKEETEPIGDVLADFYWDISWAVARLVGSPPQQTEARATLLDEREVARGHPGNPGLDRSELIYRLAKAQEAEEIRRDNPDLLWKEIAKAIQWNKGIGEPGLALLRDARKRLKRLNHGDPLLRDVAEYRAKGTKKTKET